MDFLRRLNDFGQSQLSSFLSAVKSDPKTDVPMSILNGLSTSEEVGAGKIQIEARLFGSRNDAAQYLYKLFSPPEATGLDRDSGVWAWLSLYYFNQLCPVRNGMRKPGELARWIPSGATWRYYRHLLAGPYQIYRAFKSAPEKAKIILCGPLDEPGDYVEQLASRQEVVSNHALIEAATILYLNNKTNLPKRGAQTKNKPGTLRRFTAIVNQLDPTWDLYSMSAPQILSMLPAEFDKYRPSGIPSQPATPGS